MTLRFDSNNLEKNLTSSLRGKYEESVLKKFVFQNEHFLKVIHVFIVTKDRGIFAYIMLMTLMSKLTN